MSSMITRRKLLTASTFAAAGGMAWVPRGAEAIEPKKTPQLKITGVRSYLLTTDLKRPFGVSISVPLGTTRSTLLVKVETDAGIVGWGETALISGTRGTIDDHLAPRLMGQNPTHYRSLMRRLWGHAFGNAMAIGAVEMAINDIRGKALGLPVAELFGGRLRDKVPAYASAMNYLEGIQPEDHYPDEAKELVEEGFQALKMRLGRYSVRREAKVAAAVREAVGPDIKLLADGNGAYTMKTALDMGDRLQELDFEFWEEPLPQFPGYAGYEFLREKLRLPLAGGEIVDHRATARRLMDRRAFDIIQPDVSLCGGIGEVLFIAESAALSQIGCVPHCWGGVIVIAASIHLLSLLAEPHWGFPTDTPLLELDCSENPWRTELADKSFMVDKEGFIAVPTRAGLGIEVDEKAVSRYAVR